MRLRILLSAVLLSLLVLGCAETGYYEEEDATAAAVSVTPLTAEAEEGAEGGEESGVAPVPAASGVSPKDFVKAMPSNPRAGADGLERDRGWKPLEWDNPCTASIWKRSEASDDAVLVVELEGGESDKAAVSRPVKLSFAESGTLRVDVYNSTSRAIPVAFAAFSSVDRVYSESKTQKAGVGWSHLEFDLGASTYKSSMSEWKNTAKLWGADDVREIVLLFYDGKAATLGVDRLEIDTEKKPEAEEPTGAGWE